MLQHISWHHYISAISTLTILWYLFVGLKFYRSAIFHFLGFRPSNATGIPQLFASPAITVMGEAKTEELNRSADAEEFQFSTVEPDDISDQTTPRGPTDDLTEEGRQLIDVAVAMNKPLFISLLQTLYQKFSACEGEINHDKVFAELSSYAEERLPFTISPEEWPRFIA
ncbi:MAG: hypothetical protein JKY70_13870 [Mucilaginibacter sp.]|nr:hypothetical protein [Mucilaginibacter sp.]